MAYVGIEFEEGEGGGLCIVHSTWLTPRKKEVFWPPFRQHLFDKALTRHEQPVEEEWKIYKIARLFFETDDNETAKKKIKLAEITSDLQIECDEDVIQAKKRICRPSQKIFSSSDEEIYDEVRSNNKKLLPRPPRISHLMLPVSNSPTMSSNLTPSSLEADQNFPSSSFSTLITAKTLRNCSREVDQNFSSKYISEILSTLLIIKAQNEQILKNLKTAGSVRELITVPLPDLPVKFPVSNLNELNSLEIYIQKQNNSAALSSYLATIGGKDTISKTNKIMKHVLTNQFALEYSFYGSRHNKRAFSELSLKTAITNAVQSTSSATVENINSHLENWLKHAPQCLTNETTKQQQRSDK